MTFQISNSSNKNPFNKQVPFWGKKKMFQQPKVTLQTAMANVMSNNKTLRQSYIKPTENLKYKHQKSIYTNYRQSRFQQDSKYIQNDQYQSLSNNYSANDIILGNHMSKPMNSFQRYMLSSRCIPFQSRINQQLSNSHHNSHNTNRYNNYQQYNGLSSTNNSRVYFNANVNTTKMNNNDQNNISSLKLDNPFHRKHLLLKDNFMTNNIQTNSKNITLDYHQISKYQSIDYNNQYNLQQPYVFQQHLPPNIPVFSRENSSRRSQTIKTIKTQNDAITVKNIPKNDNTVNYQQINMKIIPQIVKQLINNGGKDRIKVKGKQFYKVPLYKQV